jgi:hypothetical protein
MVEPAPRPSARKFLFDFEPSYRLPARLFGISELNAFVELEGAEITARFGPWRLSTDLDNVAEVSITGPYHFLKTAGPARLSLSDSGLTFATNGSRGVYLQFHRPVPGIDPLGVIHHPNLTVTVRDCTALLRALRPLAGSPAPAEDEPGRIVG